MALLSDIYLFVEKEEWDSRVEMSEHTVEYGVPLTDHLRAKPRVLRITGEIVGPGHRETLERLQGWQGAGAALSYVGCCILRSVQIVALSYRYSKEIGGGCRFEMELRQLRVARTAYVIGHGYTGSQEIQPVSVNGIARIAQMTEVRERYHVLGPGEDIWVLAGQYRGWGVTADSIREHNRNRDVFQPGRQGDFSNLRRGASLLMGVW